MKRLASHKLLIMLSCVRSSNILSRLTSIPVPCFSSHLRLTSSISASTDSVTESPVTHSFDEIPGPKSLPLIGNVWRYLPIIGEFQLEKLDDIGRTLHSRYGPIVREHVFGNLNIVHLFDPVDIEVMFRNEGRHPERRSHRALGKYRTDRKELYSSGGIFCENGKEWYRLRKISQQALLNPNNVNAYIAVTEEVTNELIDLIRCERDALHEMHDFEYDLYKWSLENITQVTMDTRMGCLQPNLPKDSEARMLIRAAHEVIEAIHKTEIGQTDFWRYYPTKIYRQLCDNEDIMAEIVSKYLRIKLDCMSKTALRQGAGEGTESETSSSSVTSCPLSPPSTESGKNLLTSTSASAASATASPVSSVSSLTSSAAGTSSLAASETILGQFFKGNSDASFGDILGTVLDLILAGIDTTAFSAGFVIYYLARSQDKQDKLRQEIRQFFPDHKTPITPEALSQMPYLKACVKEAMRLTPLAVGVGRVTTQDTVIRNYVIPRGVMVITHNQVVSRLPQYFDHPDSFEPERWIINRQDRSKKRPNPFLSLPFGFGPRSCPGRRVADMNTYVLLIQLLRNFRIEYHYEDIGVVTRLINIPDKAMQYRFNDISY